MKSRRFKERRDFLTKARLKSLVITCFLVASAFLIGLENAQGDDSPCEPPDGAVTKELYLHCSNILNRIEPTGSYAVKRIWDDEYHCWLQSPLLAKNLSLDWNISVKLYIDPEPATGPGNEGNPDVTVSLSYGTTVIGEDTIYNIDSGIQLYTFTIEPDITTIPAGSAIRLNVSVSSAGAGGRCEDGYIDVYYDSTAYDSRVEIVTTTYIKVEWVKTFDAPYPNGAEKDVFNYGEMVYLRANISDPFGSYDIIGARVTIEGTGIVNVSMSEKYDSNDDYKIFEVRHCLLGTLLQMSLALRGMA